MKILRTFDYRDRNGKPYQKIRIDTSDKNGRFRRRQLDGKGGWIPNWDGIEPTLYNRERLRNCNQYIFVCAGERDCDSITALGWIAVTNPESESVPWKSEYTECFDPTVQGVFILADQDTTGEKHAKDVAQSLYGHVPFVKIVNVPEGKDASEFIEALKEKGTRPKDIAAAIWSLCQEAPEWRPIVTQASIPKLDEILDDDSFIEFAPDFLSGEDKALEYILPEFIPKSATITFHGDPRSMKTLAADEVIVAAVTRTAAFGLLRFTPDRKFKVWRLAQEDPRTEERRRIKALLAGRGITEWPANLAFSIHKGINLDDATWQERVIRAIKKHGFDLIVVDPARRFSENTDKGPADNRHFTAYLRRIVTETGCAVIVIHHDTKQSASGEDSRRRGQKISGGDWFAFTDCPVQFQKISKGKSLAVPEDFKFSADPAPFSFEFYTDDSKNPSVIRLTGKDELETSIVNLELENKILDYLAEHPHASTNKIVKAAKARRENVVTVLENLAKQGKVDSADGPRRSVCWFIRGSEAVA